MLMDSYKEDFKQSDDRLDGKIDMLIQLQRDRLALEREKLAFEREKFERSSKTKGDCN